MILALHTLFLCIALGMVLELKHQAGLMLQAVIESRQDQHIVDRILYNMDQTRLIATIADMYTGSFDATRAGASYCTKPCACPVCELYTLENIASDMCTPFQFVGHWSLVQQLCVCDKFCPPLHVST